MRNQRLFRRGFQTATTTKQKFFTKRALGKNERWGRLVRSWRKIKSREVAPLAITVPAAPIRRETVAAAARHETPHPLHHRMRMCKSHKSGPAKLDRRYRPWLLPKVSRAKPHLVPHPPLQGNAPWSLARMHAAWLHKQDSCVRIYTYTGSSEWEEKWMQRK